MHHLRLRICDWTQRHKPLATKTLREGTRLANTAMTVLGHRFKQRYCLIRATEVSSRVRKLKLLHFLHLVQEAHRSNRVLTRCSAECMKSRTGHGALEVRVGFNRKHSMQDQSTWEKNVNSCKLQCRERARDTCQTKQIRHVQVNHLGLRSWGWTHRLKPLPTQRTRQAPHTTAMCMSK